MNNTKEFLEQFGISGNTENYQSTKTFPDNAQYRFEIPGIQKPGPMESLITATEYYGVQIHRVTQTKGIMLLTDSEIEEMAQIAQENKLELFLSIGPRASYDTSATAKTPEGSRIAYRLRGYNNLVYAIEDVKRAISFGVRGILLYDEGLLYILNEMRNVGELPNDVHFKVSAHMGHGNPASAKLLEKIGANSLNPVRDLQINMLATIRDTVDMPLDIHTENPKSSGGFIRHYEVPEMIRKVAPLHLKTGGSVAETHSWDTTDKQAKARARQVLLVQNIIDKYYPEAKCSKKGSKDLAVPVNK